MPTTKATPPVRWSALNPGMPMRLHRLRFIEAAPGTAGTAGAATAPAAGEVAPTAAPAAPAAQAPVLTAPVPAPATGQTFSPEYVAELRSEAAEHRVKARDTATANENLTTENASLRAQLLELQTTAALDTAISTAGGNTVAKAAIRGDNVLAGLDPTTDDYATKVAEAVTKYITEHPELKAAPVATRSAIPTAGGTGEGTKPTTLAGAIDAHYGTA